MAKPKLFAKNVSNEKFKYWIRQFIQRSKFFRNNIEEYNTSIVAYIGNIRVTFFRNGEWFYVTYGMNTIRRREFLSFLRIFGRIVNKKKDELFKILGDNLSKEIQSFLENINEIILEKNVKNYSKFGDIRILIHNIARIRCNLFKRVLYIDIAKEYNKKDKLIQFIKENFYKITRINPLKIVTYETKKSILTTSAPIGFLNTYLKGIL